MPDRRDPEDDDSYLELREEWGAPQPAAPPSAGPPDAPGDATGPRPPAPPVPPPPAPPVPTAGAAESGAPRSEHPTYVKGTARNVVVREHDFHGGHVLEFRVDRYDASGNRAVPIPVRLLFHRDGQVADGDEVELRGQWKHGTLETTLIENRTTGAQVHGGPAGCRPNPKPLGIGCGAVLLVGLLVLALAGLVPFIPINLRKPKMVTVPNVVGLVTVDAIQEVTAEGLEYQTRTVESDEPFARVVRTEPAAGTRVEAGTRVVIVSSRGRQ